MEDNTRYIVRSSYKRMLPRVVLSGLFSTSAVMIGAMLVGYYYGTNDMAITILSSPIWLVASLLSTGISYGTAVSFAQFMASNNKRAASNILSQSFSVISLAAFLFALVSWLFSPILTPLQIGRAHV